MLKTLPHHHQKQSAFTLLELLVVMAILAILAGLGLRAFGTAQEKARDNRRKQDLASVVKALDTYYNDYGQYPGSNSGQIVGCGTNGTQLCSWGQAWENDKGTLYMTQLPQDPIQDFSYYYLKLIVGGQEGYYLFAFLENERDPAAARDGVDPAFYATTNCQNAVDTCNYVVKSTNLVTDPNLI